MKSSVTSNLRPLLRGFSAVLVAIAVLWAMPRNARAQLYVAQAFAGFVSEYHATTGEVIKAHFVKSGFPTSIAVRGFTLYVATVLGSEVSHFTVGTYETTTGAVIDPGFIKLGFNNADGLAIIDNTVFVALAGIDTVGAYDATTGAAINANFLTGLDGISGVAVFRSVSEGRTVLFVTNITTGEFGEVSKYDAKTGFTINRRFITGLIQPSGLAVMGNTLFVADTAGGTVGKYDANTGGAINAEFIKGLKGPNGLAVKENTLFVADQGSGTVGKYDALTGEVINANFITGVDGSGGLAVTNPK